MNVAKAMKTALRDGAVSEMANIVIFEVRHKNGEQFAISKEAKCIRITIGGDEQYIVLPAKDGIRKVQG